MEGPKVTIVTLSYNQCEFVRRCILSVLNQSYTNIEYIVVDGGSTDGSLDVIAEYQESIAHLVVGEDNGPSDGLNIGFSRATGEIFAFLNSDDELLPFAIEDLVASLDNSPEVDVVSGHCLLVDAAGRLKRRLFSDRFTAAGAARRAAYLMQPSTIFRSSAFLRAGGFNSQNRSNWDGELWLDMSLAGSKFAVLEQFVSLYRIHAGSITGSERATALINAHSRAMFRKVFRREIRFYDWPLVVFAKIMRHIRNPRGFVERALYGRIYGSI